MFSGYGPRSRYRIDIEPLGTRHFPYPAAGGEHDPDCTLGGSMEMSIGHFFSEFPDFVLGKKTIPLD
jgi:hypothetical protein